MVRNWVERKETQGSRVRLGGGGVSLRYDRDDRRASNDSGVSMAAHLHRLYHKTGLVRILSQRCHPISGPQFFNMCTGVGVDREPRAFQQQAPGRGLQDGVSGSRSFQHPTTDSTRAGKGVGGGRRSQHPRLAGLCCHCPVRPPTNTSQAARAPRQDSGVWGTGEESEY